MPFPAIMANCVGWIAYGFVIQDWYVWAPNEIGFLLGVFYTLSCYGLVDTKVRQRGESRET
jgi:solute carrier family 50 protein (sugar transporter)